MGKKAYIIGAGVSGLTSAYILQKKGYDVTILEKNEYSGGRVHKESFADGTTYESGAMWVHDSDHPLARVFKGEGIKQVEENDAKEIDLIKKIENHLYENKDVLYKYSWHELLDEMSNEKCEIEKIIEARELFIDLAKYLGESVESLQENGFYQTFSEYLEEMMIDTEKESIIGSRFYTGTGNQQFLPKPGYSKLIEVVTENALNAGVKIEYGASVSSVSDEKITMSDGNVYDVDSNDKLVIAIATKDYDKINMQVTNQQYIEALKHIYPSGMSKLFLELNQNIDSSDLHYLNIAGEVQGGFTITDGKVVNVLLPSTILSAYGENKIQKLVLDNIIDLEGKNLEIIDSKLHYEDGESWFKQEVGFMPLENQAEEHVIFTGVVTGADDSVHSSIGAVCEALDVDLNDITELFDTETITEDLHHDEL